MLDAALVRLSQLSGFIILSHFSVILPARAQAVECPLRDQAYSVDSPLIDVLLKPEARATFESEMPGFLENAPPPVYRHHAA